MAKMSKAQARRDLFQARYRVDLRLRQMHKQIGEALPGLVSKYSVPGEAGTTVLDEVGAQALMADVDTLLAKVYGPRRGAPSVLENLIAAETAATRATVRQRAVDDIKARVDPELFKAMSGVPEKE